MINQWTLIFNSVPWKELFPYSVIYVLYAIYDILRHSLKKGRDHLILHTFVFICIKLCLHSVLPTYLRKCSDFFMIHNLFMEILKNASFWPKNCKSWQHWHLPTMMQHLITTKKYTTSEFLLEAAKSWIWRHLCLFMVKGWQHQFFNVR